MQSEGLLIPRSSVRFRLKPRTQIHVDLSCIDPEWRVLNYCWKQYEQSSSSGRNSKIKTRTQIYMDLRYIDPQASENSNLHGFEVHRPSSKGTKLLFSVIKAIINQSDALWLKSWKVLRV